MSAGRNSIEWKSRRGDSLEVAETTFSCLYNFSDSGDTSADSDHEEHELRIGLRVSR